MTSPNAEVPKAWCKQAADTITSLREQLAEAKASAVEYAELAAAEAAEAASLREERDRLRANPSERYWEGRWRDDAHAHERELAEARKALSEERERCANIAEDRIQLAYGYNAHQTAKEIAIAIRMQNADDALSQAVPTQAGDQN